MAWKRPKPAGILSKLRQVEALQSQLKIAASAIRSIGVTEVTYYRRRKELGGLRLDQLERLKEPENENARLRRAVSGQTLDKIIRAEAAKGNYEAPRAVAPASTLLWLC